MSDKEEKLSDIMYWIAVYGDEPPKSEDLLKWAKLVAELEEKAWMYDELSK